VISVFCVRVDRQGEAEEEDVVPEEGEGEEEQEAAAAAAVAEEQLLPPPDGEEGETPPLIVDADAVTGQVAHADAVSIADTGAVLEREDVAAGDSKGDDALTQGGVEGAEGKECIVATEVDEEVKAPVVTPEAEAATASEGGAPTADPAREGDSAATKLGPMDQQLDGKESAEAEKDAPSTQFAEEAQPEVTGSPTPSSADPELAGADAAPALTEAESETKAEVVTNSQAPATTSEAPSSSNAAAAATDDAATDVGDDEAKREEGKIEIPAALSRASSKSQLLLPKPSVSEPSIAPPISSGTGRAAAAALRDRCVISFYTHPRAQTQIHPLTFAYSHAQGP